MEKIIERFIDVKDIDFAILILLKYKSELNPQSPVAQKISSAIRTIGEMKVEKTDGFAEHFIGAKRISPDDLRPNMWVWNDTKKCYQQVRFIPLPDGSCYWADEKNNIIENDDLYLFIV